MPTRKDCVFLRVDTKKSRPEEQLLALPRLAEAAERRTALDWKSDEANSLSAQSHACSNRVPHRGCKVKGLGTGSLRTSSMRHLLHFSRRFAALAASQKLDFRWRQGDMLSQPPQQRNKSCWALTYRPSLNMRAALYQAVSAKLEAGSKPAGLVRYVTSPPRNTPATPKRVIAS